MHHNKVLLTPGPLTTSNQVKEAMLFDLGTRDIEYQLIVEDVRSSLLSLANANPNHYTAILMQGSGTFGVESALTTAISKKDYLLILENGAYGKRMAEIARKAGISYDLISFSMIDQLHQEDIESYIANPIYTHVAYVHCETTAGIINDITMIQNLIHKYHKVSIVDAMSSFASMPISIDDLQSDFFITSSNKCLHGVPGISIIIAKKDFLQKCQGNCPSLSLDCYEQNQMMNQIPGSFRFTSPTHVILALKQAIIELQKQGGILMRQKRYLHIQDRIDQAMTKAGFKRLIPKEIQSPVITTYLYPKHFDFQSFYQFFKDHGFLLYSGKLPDYDAFRIGNIGEITDTDIDYFIEVLTKYQGGS